VNFQLVGCSHHNSPIELRERLAFDMTQAAQALDLWRERFPAAEAVLLSTCNRVEVYSASEADVAVPDTQQVTKFLTDCHGLAPGAVGDEFFQQSGEAAVWHLFTVTASLDSLVLGEPQILSQVKQAYQLAQQRHSAGPLTHDMFQAALRVAKRVARETSLYEKRVSIPSVAIGDFARQIFDSFDDKRVLVIGAGEMGQETLRYLRDAGARDVTVANRNPQRAAELAAQFDGRSVPWDELDRSLVDADLIVSTTGAAEPIVSLERFKRLEPHRYQRPLLILDLAVPRDFDPAIAERLGVYLYSVDDLQAAAASNRQQRDAELPAALAIVEEETRLFMEQMAQRATGPIIRRLRENWQSLREQELRRLFNKLPDLDERVRAEIDQAFERYANKLLHPPLERLRDESRSGHPHGLIEALKRLFHLKD
jgi:glutamyl-tRNA reductase